MTAMDHSSQSFPAQDLVLEHLTLASALARRLMGRGVDADDLEQVARLALVKAAHRHEPAKGPFPPFATATINGELKRYFRDGAWMVRPPRRVQEIQARFMSEQLPDVTSANLDDLADRLGVQTQDLKEAASARGCFHPDSLDVGTRASHAFSSEDQNLEFVLDWAMVVQPLRDLDRAARQLLTWRFVDELTQQAIADRLGISQMQVSRRLSRVLASLREHPLLAAA